MTPQEERAQLVVRFDMPLRPCCTTTLCPKPDGQWMLYSEHIERLAAALCEAKQES